MRAAVLNSRLTAPEVARAAKIPLADARILLADLVTRNLIHKKGDVYFPGPSEEYWTALEARLEDTPNERREEGLDALGAESAAANRTRVLDAVRGGSPLTDREVAAQVGLALWAVQGHLRDLQDDKLVTKIGTKWFKGPPDDDRTVRGPKRYPIGSDRQTPRQRVETLIRDQPRTFAEIVAALEPYQIDRFEVRSALDRIGGDGYLSFGKKGYKLRKVRGQVMMPLGNAYA